MTKPLVSVCINCYNGEATIEATVRSALEQTYTALQVIVVDDCSTDNTWAILQSIQDDRLECVRLEENGHISNANNQALRRVKGDFVAHLDADDYWHPEKIERQMAFLQEHPEYGACFTLARMVDEDGNEVEDHRFRAENRDRASLLRHFLTKGNYLCHSSMLARRDVIREVGEHDVTLLYLHDFDYWIRMAMVCEIYIMDDKLLDYRLSLGSNSAREEQEQKHNVHIYEFARIANNSVRACPNDLFLQAFADCLRLQGEHTPQQIELEKAFVLFEMIAYLPQNPVLGVQYLCELLGFAKYAEVAKRDFGFTIHDLYKCEQTAVYHDAVAHQSLKEHASGLEKAFEEVNTAHQDLIVHVQNLNADRNRLIEHAQAVSADRDRIADHARRMDEARAHAEQQLALIRNSLAWKVTKPLRLARTFMRMRRSGKRPFTRDGRPAKATVMLYGYFGHNLGDDLFFDTLFKRYPDVVFVAYDAAGYEARFAAYPNVYVITRDNAYAAKIDRLGLKFKKREAFESWLIRQTDAVVHIGGSIYQQIGTWEEDLRLREKRHSRKRPFFSISSNFGPYHTEEYRNIWRTRFAVARDICMRDTYSQSLFADVASVRYAPDLLFTYEMPQATVEQGRLFLSVIDPTHLSHKFPDDQSERYMNAMIGLTRRWLESGRQVVLSSFCPFEQDDTAVDKIVRAIPAALHGSLSIVSYDGVGALDTVPQAIASSEYVLATRFHAALLGMTAGKAVIPVTYNQKVNHMLEDIGFDGYVASMEEIDGDVLFEKLAAQAPVDVQSTRDAAHAQLQKLDAFVAQKGGEVITGC